MLNQSNFIPGIILVNEGRKGRLSQFAPAHFRCGPPITSLAKSNGWRRVEFLKTYCQLGRFEDRKNYLKKQLYQM